VVEYLFKQVGILVDKHGYNEYVDMLKELKAKRWGPALESHYMPLEELDKEVREAL